MIRCTCRICFGIPHAPLSVSLAPEQQRFYTGPKSNPHVSFSKGVTDQWWDLGHFLIHFSPSEAVYTSSLNTTTLAQRSLFLSSHSSPLSVSTLLNTDTLMHPIHSLVPSSLWAANQYDVGLINGPEPFIITPKSNYRPKPWQYPLNPEAARCIWPLFEALLKAGVIVPCSNSPVHIPIQPGKKIRDKGQHDEGRVVQDLRAVNAAVHAPAPLISNPYSLAQMTFLMILFVRTSSPLTLSP